MISFTVNSFKENSKNREWFQPWNRPEYQEWALEIPEGYLLHILRKEKDRYLVVQAKLIMEEKGLPKFEVIEQHHLPDEQAAKKLIQFWRDYL